MYQKELDQYIDQHFDEMVADLKTLVKINSQRGPALQGKPFGEGPAQAVAAAGELMKRYGLRVRNYENYVITGDLGEGERALDILAHLDVVPVTDDWTVTEPFSPVVKEGRIYGRGTSDDKGPAVAALYALRAIRESGINLKNSVRLILGSDEECGSSDLEYYYSREQEAPGSFTPDSDFPLINLELARYKKSFTRQVAAGGRVEVLSLEAGDKVNVVPAKARAVMAGLSMDEVLALCDKAEQKTGAAFTAEETAEGIEIRVKGVAAHASTPEKGNNALTALLTLVEMLSYEPGTAGEALSALSHLWPHKDTCGQALGVQMNDELSGELTMNLGILRLENGTLYGEFDCRAPLCATQENLVWVIRGALEAAGFAVEEGDMKPAHFVPETSELVQTLLQIYEEYTGEKGKAMSTGGGTYVHDLRNGVAFGCMFPDVDNHMHGDDEFMVLDVLKMSAKMFAQAVVRLCGVNSEVEN